MTFLEKIKFDLKDKWQGGNPNKVYTDRKALSDLVHHFERLDSEIRANHKDTTERSPKDYAIEHAEYMATSADNYLKVMNEVLTEDMDFEDGTDAMHDARSKLELMIFEFRKRAARAK